VFSWPANNGEWNQWRSCKENFCISLDVGYQHQSAVFRRCWKTIRDAMNLWISISVIGQYSMWRSDRKLLLTNHGTGFLKRPYCPTWHVKKMKKAKLHPYCMSVVQELLQVDKETCPLSCVKSTMNDATAKDSGSHILYWWSMVSPQWPHVQNEQKYVAIINPPVVHNHWIPQ